jgi:hypothetical protein
VLVAVAFCPAPPVLVPEVASGASLETAKLLLECEAAVQALLEERPHELLVLGGGATTCEHRGDASGTLLGFGVDVTAGGSGARTLPLSLTIGAWLLDRAGTDLPRSYVEIDSTTPQPAAARLGRSLGARWGRTALLVMGDGSATRTPKAPGSLDPRAESFDAATATALAHGDTVALALLDETRADALAVSGRAAWQAAAAAVGPGRQGLKAQLTYDSAPYGVGYFVADWLLPVT